VADVRSLTAAVATAFAAATTFIAAVALPRRAYDGYCDGAVLTTLRTINWFAG
jgi:hypothetical protein